MNKDISEAIKKYIYIVEKIVKSIPAKNSAERDDLRQEGLIGLWKALVSYDQEKNNNFEAYASIIVRNQIINELRKKNTKKQAILSDSESIDDDEKGYSIKDVIGENDVYIDSNALKKLDVNFVKVCIQAKNVTDIKAITGLSRVMVKRKLDEEKRKLRESLID